MSGRGRALGVALRLWRHPRVTREELVAFQNRKLRQLVRHAYWKVPFYRRLLDQAGVGPDDVRSLEDLTSLPITAKREFRASPGETMVRGRDSGRLVSHLTSGSTGQPFRIWRSTAEESLLSLFGIRARRQFGVRVRDRAVSISEPPIGGKGGTPVARFARAVGLYRDQRIDCRKPPDEIVEQLERTSPDVISGYPSALALVAERIAGRRSPSIKPRLLCTGGEPLQPFSRRRIEEGFRAPLFEIYGAHECSLLAWQCPQGRHLHVCDDNVVLEVLRDGAPVAEGEGGEVVLTSLHSHTMPFIRYSLGDLAVRGPESCPCGQPFSTLGSVQGRAVDYFRLPGGRSIHPFAVTGPLLRRDHDWIDRHQMVQEMPDRVVLRIAPLREPPPDGLRRLRSLGERTFGPEARFRIELVTQFPPQPRGKFQSYRSFSSHG